MRLRWAGAAAIAVMATSGPAVGEGDEAQEESLELLDAGKYSAALRSAERAVRRWPSSPTAHYEYGVVLRVVFRRADAMQELERARALQPDNGDVVVELAAVAAELGDLERARALLAEPPAGESEWFADVKAHIDRQARMRNGPRATFTPGSPSAFVAGVMRKLAEHEIEEVLRDDVDRAFTDRWAADSMVRSSSTDDYIEGLAGEVEQVMERQSAGFVVRGYDVAAAATVRDGRTVVAVTLLVDARNTPMQLELLAKAAADPSLPLPMDPEVMKVLRGLDPADRKLSLAAAGARTVSSEIPIEFELVGRTGAWKVADVIGTDTGQRLSEIMGVFRALVKRGVVPEPAQRSLAYRIGEGVGAVLLGLLVAGFLIGAVRMARRR